MTKLHLYIKIVRAKIFISQHISYYISRPEQTRVPVVTVADYVSTSLPLPLAHPFQKLLLT